jgi:hypothetical protein
LVGKEEAQLVMSPIFANITMAKLPRESVVEFQKLHKRYLVAFHPNGQFTWIGGKREHLLKRSVESPDLDSS